MTTSKQVYRVSDIQLQYILNSISDRLDKVEGWRGTPEFQADVDLNTNLLTNVGSGSAMTDAAVRSELAGSSPTFTNVTINGILTVNDDGPIKWLDSTGTVLHQFGD